MTTTLTDIAVNPVAALFPMLGDEELADLAADITERGLLQPIILDADGCILDGRNRYAACEIAGVEPRFETYEGDDPDGYALASGTMRRNLTQGQQAIVVAKFSKLEKFGDQTAAVRRFGVSHSRLSEALLILEASSALADAVLAPKGTPMSTALAEARKILTLRREREAKLARLAEHAPDLALLVDEGMDVDEATGALNAREEKARREAEQLHAEEQAQKAAELAARQEALIAWGQFSDNVIAALSHAKTYEPPADTDIYPSRQKVTARIEELIAIARSWNEDAS